MVRKCCVTGCKSNHLSDRKGKSNRVPNKLDPEERQRWIKVIARDNIPDGSNTVVCVKHFPPGFPVLKKKGKSRLRDPSSVFENIPKSLIPTPPPPK